ncbi:MAG: glycosyltransferase family 39 protein [Patescibacteria group bacterium]
MFNFLAQNYLTRGFWGDEAWTSMISLLPYTQMLKTTAADFHPPGYYTIVGLVYRFLPPTEINTRLVSLVFYFLTLFMVYKLASYVKGGTFGVLSALVVALNPIFFTYAFEARNYTMFAFVATGSVFFLIELSKKFSKARAIAFILFTTLGMYTHYYMFFILGAQGIYLLLFDRKIFLKMMLLYVVVGVLYLPWLKALVGQLTSVSSSYWIAPIDWRHTHYEALLRILGGEQKNDVLNIFSLRDTLFWLSISLLGLGVVQHILRHKFEKPYLLIWLWAVVPFILATLPGLQVDGFKFPFRPIFFWRYLIGSSIPLSMVIVHAGLKLPKQMALVLIGAIILLSAIVDVRTFSSSPYSFREEYQNKVLEQIETSDDIVTILPSFAEVIYYKDRNGLSNNLIVSPEGLVQSSGKSLLDTYVENGKVTLGESKGANFELRRDDNGQIKTINDR